MIVTFNGREAIGRSLPALQSELRPDDELIVCDNASTDGTADAVLKLAPKARLIRNQRNEGFPAACNVAAAAASGDLLVFLNPDAVVEKGFAEAIRRPLAERRGWSAWMGLVTMHGGTLVNTSGGIIHFTGISWAGGLGFPTSEIDTVPREVAFVSGACLVVNRARFMELGAMPSEFFLYCEDVDLSLRLRLAGDRLGLEPTARVDHDYDFHKGASKWRMLERNRWATVLRTYPGPLLLLLMPALLATEIAILGTAAAGGWTRQKLMASTDVLRALPRLLRERRGIQRGRRIGVEEFARHLTPDLSSPYLGGASQSRVLNAALTAYRRGVLAALARRSRSSA